MLGRQQMRPHAVVVPLPDCLVGRVGAEGRGDVALRRQRQDGIEYDGAEIDRAGAGSRNDVIAAEAEVAPPAPGITG